MVKRSRSATSCLPLLLCYLLLAGSVPGRAESGTATSEEERQKQALFLKAREVNRIEARRLSSRGSAKRSKAPNTPHRPIFGGFFKKKKNSPAEIEGLPPAPAPSPAPKPRAQKSPAPRTKNIAASTARFKPEDKGAASRASSPKPSATPTPAPQKPTPKIAAAPAPKPKAPAVTKTVSGASETALLLPDVQVQAPAPVSTPSAATYDGIKLVAESQAELQKGAFVYEGNAIMKSPAFLIESNRISVGFTNAGDKIEEARAVGAVSVRITPKGSNGNISAQSARAHFDSTDQSITLSGWPEYSLGDERRIATTPDTVIVLFLDGRVKTEGETKLSLAGR